VNLRCRQERHQRVPLELSLLQPEQQLVALAARLRYLLDLVPQALEALFKSLLG
jgi:hypothetical protein